MYVCPSEIHTYMVYQPSMPLENHVGLVSVDPIESLNFSNGFDLCNWILSHWKKQISHSSNSSLFGNAVVTM